MKGMVRALAYAVVVCGLGTGLGAQIPSHIVPDEPSCARCTINIQTGIVLGDNSGPGAILGTPLAVSRDSRGRLWVVDGIEMPKVYDATGSFIREIGKRGREPGQFIHPMDAIPVPGDSMLMIDGDNRGTVVGPDLSIGRAILLPLAPRPSVVLHWPDTVWANGNIPSSEYVGLPIHVLSFASDTARILAAFGPNGGELRAGGVDAIWQWISVPRSRSVWTANRVVYALTQWDRMGSMRLELIRRPSWFAGQSKFWMGNPENAPPPMVAAVHEAEDGLVWVFVNVAAPRWVDAWASLRGEGAGEIAASQIAMEKLYITRVEVIDPKLGRVVARTTLDSWVIGVVGDGRAASVIRGKNGELRVRLSTLLLSRQ